MKTILKQGQKGLRQDPLIYGKEYTLYRDGEYIGDAIYSDDEIHGDAFLKEADHNGLRVMEVYAADEWILLNNQRL